MLGSIGTVYPLLFFLILTNVWQLRTEAFIVHKPVSEIISIRENKVNTFSSIAKYPSVSSIYSIESKSIRSHLHILAQSSILTADLVEVGTNVLIGIGGVVAFLVVLTFVVTGLIIPSAARQIEDMAKQFDPQLWREYEQKLGPGETLAMRPELMQELGTKVIEMQNKYINGMDKRDTGNSMSKVSETDEAILPEVVQDIPSTSTKKPSTEGSIDVEVTSKNKWDD